MQVEWYGQSAFRLSTGDVTVFVDPFGDMSALAGRGLQFDYPAITGVSADLLLVTHEHGDHNGVEAIGGSPAVLRSTAERLESPLGEVLAVASEHDQRAGTERGPNTIFVFELDGTRVAHFGDFGQASLRDEQAEVIGTVELLFVPVGGGPTTGAAAAAEIAERDALPHAADRVPRAGRRVPGAVRQRRPAGDAHVRHGRATREDAARGRAGGAVGTSPRNGAP